MDDRIFNSDRDELSDEEHAAFNIFNEVYCRRLTAFQGFMEMIKLIEATGIENSPTEEIPV